MNNRGRNLILLLCAILVTVSGKVYADGFNRAEYFFGDDPGFGKAIQATINGDGEVEIETSITELSVGVNNIYFRAQYNGAWSQTKSKTIYRIGTSDGYFKGGVSKAEYYWDTDPGAGKGVSLTLTEAGDDSYFIVTEDISTKGMSVGKHKLFVRVCSGDGFWSTSSNTNVLILSEIDAKVEKLEYFWDNNDPGEGQATPLSFTELADKSVMVTDKQISTDTLSYGLHKLKIRAYANNGWSFIYQDEVGKNAVPEFSIYGGNTVCQNNAIFVVNSTKNVQPETTFSWDLNGDGKEDSNSSDEMLTYTYTKAGVFDATLTVSHNGECESVYTQRVTVNSISNPSVSLYVDDASVCEGAEICFTTKLNNVSAEPDYTWYVNDEELTDEKNDTLLISTLSDGDKVKVKIVTTNECSPTNEAVSSAKTVTIYDTPDVKLADLGDISIYGSPFMLSNGSPSGGVYYLDDKEVTFIAPSMYEIGEYTLSYVYTSGGGCVSWDEMTLNITDGTSGVSDDIKADEIKLQPNPVKLGESVLVDYDFEAIDSSDMMVEIYNSEGRKVTSFAPDSYPIMVNQFPTAGVYVIKLSFDNNLIFSDRVIVK